MDNFKYPAVKKLTNHELWQCIITPIEEGMQPKYKKFLERASKEFFRRKISLRAICK